MLSTNSRDSVTKCARMSRSTSANTNGSGARLASSPKPEPLEREVRRERLGARVGEHALDLLPQHGGIGEPVGRRELEQLGIGDRAP